MSNENGTEADIEEQLEESFSPLKVVVGDGKEDSPLRESWHYLQVYAAWGVRLPYTTEDLKTKLHVEKPDSYSFFSAMQETYQLLHDTCEYFIGNVFDDVVEVGQNARNFARDASSDDGGLFDIVIEQLDDDPATALALVKDLQETARNNATHAGKVSKHLSSFKSKLSTVEGKLDRVQAEIENDDKISKEQIDHLLVGDGPGSLSDLRTKLHNKEKQYDHEVVVASTTVTYAWVPVVGLASAVAVAATFGSKATSTLNRVRELKAEIKNAHSELRTAYQSHLVHESAMHSVDKATDATDAAITHTTNVQNAWTEIADGLDEVASKVEMMTRNDDLKSKTVIKVYAGRAGKRWSNILPSLEDLMTGVYIDVEPGEVEIDDFARRVQAAIEEEA